MDHWIGGIPDRPESILTRALIMGLTKYREKQKPVKFILTATQFKMLVQLHMKEVGGSWDEATRSVSKNYVVAKHPN